MKTKYTPYDAAYDLQQILPMAGTGLAKHNILNHCAVTGEALAQPIFLCVATDLDVHIFSVSQATANQYGEDLLDHLKDDLDSSCAVAISHDFKSKVKAYLFAAVENQSEHLPFVRKVLRLDSNLDSNMGVVYNLEKNGDIKGRTVLFQWRESDPLFVGGVAAKDAIAVSKSIKEGKTEAMTIRDKVVLLSSKDKKLMDYLSKPYKEAA